AVPVAAPMGRTLTAILAALADGAVERAVVRGPGGHPRSAGLADYSGGDMAQADRAIAWECRASLSPRDLRRLARGWGAYVGEVVRRHWGGEWVAAQREGR